MAVATTKFDCAREYKTAAVSCEACFYSPRNELNSHPDFVYTTDSGEKANENAMNALQSIINNTKEGEQDRAIAEGALKVCRKSCLKNNIPQSKGIVRVLQENRVN